jgi:hypothetical protein
MEQVDGRWTCRHGPHIYDQHAALPDALDHLRSIAATMNPAELIVHRLDGSVENIGLA